MASLSSCSDRNTPRLSHFLARLAKKPSTALSQEADVGVEWKNKTWMHGDPLQHLGVLVGGIVIDSRGSESIPVCSALAALSRAQLRPPNAESVSCAASLAPPTSEPSGLSASSALDVATETAAEIGPSPGNGVRI
jgi:hypothetical protein